MNTAEGLLGLEPSGVIFFGHIYREKTCADIAVACALQIPLALGEARTHAATVAELAIQFMHMAVKDQRSFLNGAGASRDIGCR